MKWCSVSQIWSKPSSSVHSICSSSRWTTSSWVKPGAAWKKKKVPKRMGSRSYTGSPVGAAELQDAIAHALRRLLARHHGPVVRLRKHLAQIVGARRGVRGIVSRDNEGGDFHRGRGTRDSLSLTEEEGRVRVRFAQVRSRGGAGRSRGWPRGLRPASGRARGRPGCC